MITRNVQKQNGSKRAMVQDVQDRPRARQATARGQGGIEQGRGMGSGTSTQAGAELSSLTTVHLPPSATIAIEDDGNSVRVMSCTAPGHLLPGDLIKFIQGIRVMSCTHAHELLGPKRPNQPAVPNLPAAILRVLVKRVQITEAVLERPEPSVPFGIRLISGKDYLGVVVANIDDNSAAAKSGMIVLGCAITHIDGEEVKSATQGADLLKSKPYGKGTALTMRHTPRSNAFVPKDAQTARSTPKLYLQPARGDAALAGTEQPVTTPRVGDFSPHPSPTAACDEIFV